MNKRNYKAVCLDFLLAAVLLVLDQYTKYLAVQKLMGKKAYVIFQNVLELDYLENRGSAFGLFQDKRIFLLAVGVVFMCVAVFFLFRIPREKKYIVLHVVASMIIAGGIGNMIDRFRLGYVVDFISFVLIHYPVFNVADIYVVLGMIGMICLVLFVYKEEDWKFLPLSRKK